MPVFRQRAFCSTSKSCPIGDLDEPSLRRVSATIRLYSVGGDYHSLVETWSCSLLSA
jgi:hypothetical protein